MNPDTSALPAVRSQLRQSEDKLRTALVILRKAGWEENANELLRTLKHLQVWTQKDGWLDFLEKDK